MNDKKEKRYVSPKETLAYGFANSGQVFGYNLVAGGYLSMFFTKVFEIPPAAVSTMILFLGIWDTVNDPLMGALVDKTRTRYGKLRPYLLFVPLPLAITTILLFSGPLILADTKKVAVKIVYMYISYFIWEFFYTIGDIPFWGMSAAISPNPADRTRCISSARFLSGIIGGLSITLLVALMDLSNNNIIGLSLQQVFCLMSVIAATFGMALFSLAGIFCKERVVQTVKEPSVIEGFKVMFKNKPLLLIVIGNIIGTLGGLAGVFQTYYFAEVININSLMLLLGLPGTIIGWATYLVIPKLKKRFDNRQIVFLNITTKFAVATLVFIIGFKYFDRIAVVLPLLMIRNVIFSFFDTINLVIPTEMIGDTIDYMEWKTGERNEGVSFSVLTFVSKLTGSVSTSIATAVLPLIGLAYTTTNGVQTTVKGEHTDLWIWAFFSFIPYALGLLSLIPYFWYDLTGKKLSTIRSDLEERRSELSKQVSGGEANE
ncbi:MAG: MFS transporter [Eubacterium sp.]|nr:MFS transporter [Eubacterium sp.]